MKCERCGAKPKNPMDLHDYCDVCGKNLCADCMAKGCCKFVPAASGAKADMEAPSKYKKEAKKI